MTLDTHSYPEAKNKAATHSRPKFQTTPRFEIPSKEVLINHKQLLSILRANSIVKGSKRLILSASDIEIIILYLNLRNQITCNEPLKVDGVTPEKVKKMTAAEIALILIPDEETRILVTENIRLANDVLR